jgi:GDP-D-mannose dehydratase
VEVVFGFAKLDWKKLRSKKKETKVFLICFSPIVCRFVKADDSLLRHDDQSALVVDVARSREALKWVESRPLEDTLWEMLEHDCQLMGITPPQRNV